MRNSMTGRCEKVLRNYEGKDYSNKKMGKRQDSSNKESHHAFLTI